GCRRDVADIVAKSDIFLEKSVARERQTQGTRARCAKRPDCGRTESRRQPPPPKSRFSVVSENCMTIVTDSKLAAASQIGAAASSSLVLCRTAPGSDWERVSVNYVFVVAVPRFRLDQYISACQSDLPIRLGLHRTAVVGV
ncbi:hypothetical protein BaRGS_00002452, partial [Batillaria attramentaria]